MKILAIDMDGTATMNPSRVNALHNLYDPDAKENVYFVVIHTARPSCIRKETENELAELGINYSALVMDKLKADIYVDDKNQGGLKWPETKIKKS